MSLDSDNARPLEPALKGDGAVFCHAMRLFNDAAYLRDDARYASAYALALLALEEVGKAILECWQLPPLAKLSVKGSAHLRKQTAATTVVLAHAITHRFIGPELAGMELIAARDMLARFIAGSSEGRDMDHAAIGVLDRIKHIALYRDENATELGLTPERIGASDVNEIIDMGATAAEGLGDEATMEIGRAIYGSGGTLGVQRFRVKKPSTAPASSS